MAVSGELHHDHEEDAHGHGASTVFIYMQEAYKEPFSVVQLLAVAALWQHKAGCQPFGASAPLGSSAVLMLLLTTCGRVATSTFVYWVDARNAGASESRCSPC